jgi:glycosyltransferase involved in cell wall biosynthesis
MSNIKSKPIFSIITVVLNGEKFLRETIESVKNQSFKDYEYIIIDGGSTDKTLDIIKEYSEHIDFWISEKDLGLYDAFNKGILMAKGKYIGIINSDDVYTVNALEIINEYFSNNPKIDFVFGSVKKHWGILHGYRPKKIYYSWGFYSSHSTGFFIKKESANKVGLYDLRYKYHADYDFFFRMIVKNKLKGMATRKDEVTGVFRRGGFSSKIPFRKLFFEELKIRYNNNQNLILIFVIFIHKFFKNIKKLLFNN